MKHSKLLPKSIFRFFAISFGIIFLLCLLLALGLATYVTSAHFRDSASHFISGKTGREVKLEGDIRLETHHAHPTIVLNNVKIGNASWAKDPLFFEANRIALSIDPSALLHLRLVFPMLVLDAPHLFLERNKERQVNWEMTHNPQSAPLNAAAPNSRHAIPLIGRLKITNGTLTYTDAMRNVRTTLDISTVMGKSSREEDSLHISGKGTYQKQPFHLSVTGASLLQLREGSAPYPFSLATSIGPTCAEVKGTVKDPITLEALNIQLRLQGQNAADLFPITGIALPPTPAYAISGLLTRSDKHWDFSNFSGTLGNSDLHGSISW